MSRLNTEQRLRSGERYLTVQNGPQSDFPPADPNVKDIITTVNEHGHVEDSFIMTKALTNKPNTDAALSSVRYSPPVPQKDRVEDELKYAASLCFWVEKRLEQMKSMKANSDPKKEDPEVTKYINDSITVYEDNLVSLKKREASLKDKIEAYMKQF